MVFLNYINIFSYTDYILIHAYFMKHGCDAYDICGVTSSMLYVIYRIRKYHYKEERMILINIMWRNGFFILFLLYNLQGDMGDIGMMKY